MIISRDEIAGLIPHSGAMCLLDGVLAWDEASIQCLSARHRAPDNPLRHEGRLGILCGIEFAAQAMAVHGRLAGAVSARPRSGYLVSLRDVVCQGDRLDCVEGHIIVDAVRLMGDEERVIYSFSLTSEARQLISGRATVVLQVVPS